MFLAQLFCGVLSQLQDFHPTRKNWVEKVLILMNNQACMSHLQGRGLRIHLEKLVLEYYPNIQLYVCLCEHLNLMLKKIIIFRLIKGPYTNHKASQREGRVSSHHPTESLYNNNLYFCAFYSWRTQCGQKSGDWCIAL